MQRGPQRYRRTIVFAVKGGRFITHLKKLTGVEVPLANFFASGVLALGRKLGPMLWQLPPNLGFDPDRMEAFFALLPRTMGRLARWPNTMTTKVPGDRALVAASHPQHPIRHAVEVRHESFRSPACYELLRRNDIALVVADNPGKWPIIEEQTDLADVRPPARSRGALRKRLQRRGAGPVGDQDHDMGRRWSGRLRVLRQRREGPGPVRRDGSDAAARARALEREGSRRT